MHLDDKTRLHHMMDAAQTALEFAEGESRQSLEDDQKLLFALVRAVEIIGEAASRISEELQADHPQIPWHAIRGMRNRLVHGYFDVDADQVWTTITDDLPELILQLEELLQTLN